MKKKLLAVLLTLAMVASLAVLPVAALDVLCPEHGLEHRVIVRVDHGEGCLELTKCNFPGCTWEQESMSGGRHVYPADDGDCTTAVTCEYGCGHVSVAAKAAHAWDSETGKCTNPGCEAVCKHPGTTGKVTSTSADGHMIGFFCDECSMALRGGIYPHDWSNGDGVCAEEACGYVCTDTTDANGDHKCDTCGKVLTSCPDGTSKTVASIYDEQNKVYDMEQHSVTTACATCGKVTSTVKENHTWVNGKCTDCALECKHEGATHKIYSTYIDPETGKVDITKHTVTTLCDVCGATVSQTTAAHKWDDGTCADCKLVCDHTLNDNAATCTGSAACSVCGKKDVVKALSHWFSQWKPCSDGYHAAYCIRKGCDWTAGMPCEWTDLTFTTADGEEMTVSICPVCGAVRHEDSVFQAIDTATVKMGKSGLPRGELIVRGMETPYGDCQYAFTVGYEYSGWLEEFLGNVTITIPVELEGEFRLVYVDENLEGQIFTDVEYTYESGKLSFVTSDQGIFLILPVEAE